MSKKVKYSGEPMEAEIVDDFLPPPEELAAIDRAWLEEVTTQRGFRCGPDEGHPF